MLVIEFDRMPQDINKAVSEYLKERELIVADADVQVLVKSEPGRTWLKKPGETSVTAYG